MLLCIFFVIIFQIFYISVASIVMSPFHNRFYLWEVLLSACQVCVFLFKEQALLLFLVICNFCFISSALVFMASFILLILDLSCTCLSASLSCSERLCTEELPASLTCTGCMSCPDSLNFPVSHRTR